MTARRRSLTGTTAGLLAARVAGLGMGVTVFAVLTRALPPARFATLTLGFALTQIATGLNEWGSSSLQLKAGALDPGAESSLAVWTARVRLGVGALLAVAGVGVAVALTDGIDDAVTVGLILASVPVAALAVGFTVLQGQLRLPRMAALVLLQSGLWLVAVAALARLHAGLRAYGAAYLGCSIVYGLVVRRLTRHRAEERRSMAFADYRRHMRGGVSLTAVSAVVMLYYKVDAVLVYHVNGALAAAHYAVAYRFLDQAAVVPVTLHAVAFPLLLRVASDGRALTELVDRYLKTVLAAVVPMVALGMLLAGPFVGAVFGPEYRTSAHLLQTLLPAFALICLGYVVTGVATALGRTRTQLAVALAAAAANLGLNLALLPRFGPQAAAWSTIATEAVVVGGLWVGVCAPAGLRVPWGWTAKLAAVVALATIAATVAAVAGPVGAALAFAATYVPGLAGARIGPVRNLRSWLAVPPAVPPALPPPVGAEA